MGHRVRPIPPQYVKPFVRRSKNDRNDAEAIREAASRRTMRTVSVKSAEEQASTIIVKHRELMVNRIGASRHEPDPRIGAEGLRAEQEMMIGRTDE
jgi:transposase